MGVMIDEGALRRAEVAADLAEQRLDAGRIFETDDRLPADMLAAMLTNCIRSGAMQMRLPVPEWRDAFSRLQGPAAVLEIVSDALTDDGLLVQVLQVLGRAMATDEQARAVVAEIAAGYGKKHGSAS